MIFNLARIAVLFAVLLQAAGKVTFGTYLTYFPAPLFVFISFSLATLIFWLVPNRKVGAIAWWPLIAMNVATATTFISIFVALKIVGPAIVGAIEVGFGPVFAASFGALMLAEKVTMNRFFVCGGILIGCCLLGYSAFETALHESVSVNTILALFLSVLAGSGAVVISMASKSLMSAGWSRSAVLAHRSYVIIPVSLLIWYFGDFSHVPWNFELALRVFFVACISVILPLYLLLIGLKHCDVYTVMVTMAAQPFIVFIFEIASPTYQPTTMTAVGIAVVTVFVITDVILNTGMRKKMRLNAQVSN